MRVWETSDFDGRLRTGSPARVRESLSSLQFLSQNKEMCRVDFDRVSHNLRPKRAESSFPYHPQISLFVIVTPEHLDTLPVSGIFWDVAGSHTKQGQPALFQDPMEIH